MRPTGRATRCSPTNGTSASPPTALGGPPAANRALVAAAVSVHGRTRCRGRHRHPTGSPHRRCRPTGGRPSQLALVATAAGAAAWAFRVGLFGLAWLGLTASVGSLVALWSVTRITGGFNDHQAFWFASIGLVDAAVAAAAVGESIRRLHAVAASGARLIAPVAHGALLSAILMLGLYQVDRARRGSFPITATLASIAVFDDSIGQYLAREHLRKPLFRIAGERWDLAVGMLQELHRRGIPFAVEDSWMPMFPDRFRASGDEDAELTITGAFDAAELTVRVGNVTINRSARARVEAIRISPSPR